MMPIQHCDHAPLRKPRARPTGCSVRARELAIGPGARLSGWRIVRPLGQPITKPKAVGGF
jgi:hypothetical protein